MTEPTLRYEVAAANRAIAAHGLVTLSFGNVSGVDREAGTLLIKPSGLACAEIGPDDLVEVALDDGRVVAGNRRPSSDTPTHRHLYREFPSIGGVVHTHSTSAAAWAQAGRPIPALGTTHADYFRGPVLVSRQLRRDEIEGDYELATGAVIAETIRSHDRSADDSPAVLVRAHGPFAWGATPAVAVENAIALEQIATIAWRTLGIDPSAPAISDELLRRHFDRKHGEGAYYGQPSSAEVRR
ncbi:MAG TPA: L-ribulose-5-phosphate 4-epimerase AraD [Candidatus Limnocylindrales bacterium]|nr:L-ribulose-5-phosphate 4-epimerase AraD [Candidatus Limnocylindrales bacterium]